MTKLYKIREFCLVIPQRKMLISILTDSCRLRFLFFNIRYCESNENLFFPSQLFLSFHGDWNSSGSYLTREFPTWAPIKGIECHLSIFISCLYIKATFRHTEMSPYEIMKLSSENIDQCRIFTRAYLQNRHKRS